jgi:hypothetical protein
MRWAARTGGLEERRREGEKERRREGEKESGLLLSSSRSKPLSSYYRKLSIQARISGWSMR